MTQISYPTQRAYNHALSTIVPCMNEVVQVYCSECGEQTALMHMDQDRWDRLCSRCRRWKRGFVGWLLSLWGWKLQRSHR